MTAPKPNPGCVCVPVRTKTEAEVALEAALTAFPIEFPLRFPEGEGKPHREPFDEGTLALLEELRRLETLTGVCL